MEELREYEQKGQKNIPQLRVSRGVFEAYKNAWESYAYYTFDTDLWCKVRKGLWKKYEVYLFNQKDGGEGQKYRLIANANRLYGRACRLLDHEFGSIAESTEIGLRNILELIGDSHKDYELILDSTLKDEQILRCRPQDAKRALKTAIQKDFTQEEFAEFVQEHGLSEEDKKAQGIKPRHCDTDTHGKVIKYTDCLYQDIHKAHASYLLETFKDYPSVIKFVKDHLKKATKAKKQGNIAEATKHKDFINFAVGMLGQRYKSNDNFGHKKDEDIKWCYGISTRSLFNDCMRITRSKIDNQIRNLRISIFETRELYSNTDGFILQHPDWNKVADSDKIGDFGTESVKNNEVWFYSVENSINQTGYSIHQYYDEDGNKHIVGNLPDVLKEQVDLSRGIVVSYKTRIDELNYHNYENVKQINVDMETR